MSFGLLYWILMLLWLVFGLWSNWPVAGPSVKPAVGHVMLFVLLVLLGWKVFGSPVHP